MTTKKFKWWGRWGTVLMVFTLIAFMSAVAPAPAQAFGCGILARAGKALGFERRRERRGARQTGRSSNGYASYGNACAGGACDVPQAQVPVYQQAPGKPAGPVMPPPMPPGPPREPVGRQGAVVSPPNAPPPVAVISRVELQQTRSGEDPPNAPPTR